VPTDAPLETGNFVSNSAVISRIMIKAVMEHPDDHERFMRLFLQHEPEILRNVLLFVPQPADARDIVQEAAIALWKHFGDYDPARPFSGWAIGFARMEVKKFLRRAHRQRYLDEAAAAALMEAEHRPAGSETERARLLTECCAQLPAEHRRILESYYLEELRVSAVAERYGRSVEAIYKLLQRIRSALLDCIDRKLAAERS